MLLIIPINIITCAHQHQVGHSGLAVGERVPGQGEVEVGGDLVVGKIKLLAK